MSVLSAPTWAPLETADALARLQGIGHEIPEQRLPLVGFVVSEATDTVKAWLAHRGLALGLTRYEADVGSEGTLEIVAPFRPILSDDLEVLHDGEPLDGVKIIKQSRLFHPQGFPSTVQVETFGRFGTYYDIGPARPDITLRFWAGYAQGELPGELTRAIWLVVKAWYERDLRETDLAYEQRPKTAGSYRKGRALPEEAAELLTEYSESFNG